jgi:hypothetical protein
MLKTIAVPVPAKLWKLLLVLALAAAAFGMPAPRSAEASACTDACQAAYIACRDNCVNICPTRVPCYSNCVAGCSTQRTSCLSHC